jgi:hypothetical protein
VTPEDPSRGFAVVALATGARMVIALAALAAYFVFAPGGLAPFGLALGLSFIAGLAVEAGRASRLNTTHPPA